MATDLVAGLTGNVTQQQQVYVRDRTTGTTSLVSTDDPAGLIPANNGAYQPAISADGRYVAFLSASTNLGVVNYNYGYTQVYVRDLQTGTTSLVSHATTGLQDAVPYSYPSAVSISGDGGVIAFESYGYGYVASPATTAITRSTPTRRRTARSRWSARTRRPAWRETPPPTRRLSAATDRR